MVVFEGSTLQHGLVQVVDAMHSWPDKKFKESIQVTPTDVTSTDVVAPEEPGFDGLPSMWRVR